MATSTERRRGGWRWFLSYWLGRLYRLIRLFLLPPSPPPPPKTEEEDLPKTSDDDLVFIPDTDDVKIPRRMTAEAVGYDIFCPKNVRVSPGAQLSIETGWRVFPPPGFHVRLHSRSSLAVKGLTCFPGIIDPGKRN